jgi:hypothetical protein
VLHTPHIISAGWKSNITQHWTGYGLTDATREMLEQREAERKESKDGR